VACDMLITSSVNKLDYMEIDNFDTLSLHKESKLTIWTLAWMGFWTGVVVCGFVLLLR
jgi:hypothetical protein